MFTMYCTMSRSFGRKTENVVATPGASGDEMMLLRRMEMRETFVNVITSCGNTASAAIVSLSEMRPWESTAISCPEVEDRA